jgi:hypothetical protein
MVCQIITFSSLQVFSFVSVLVGNNPVFIFVQSQLHLGVQTAGGSL